MSRSLSLVFFVCLFLSFLCCTHSFEAARWVLKSGQKLELGVHQAEFCTVPLEPSVSPHSARGSALFSRCWCHLWSPLTLLSPSSFASPAPFLHFPLTRWLYLPPNQPCSFPNWLLPHTPKVEPWSCCCPTQYLRWFSLACYRESTRVLSAWCSKPLRSLDCSYISAPFPFLIICLRMYTPLEGRGHHFHVCVTTFCTLSSIWQLTVRCNWIELSILFFFF